MAKTTNKPSRTSLKIAWLCLLFILLGAYAGLELMPPSPDPTAVTLALPSLQAPFSHQAFSSTTQQRPTLQSDSSSGMERMGDISRENHQSDSTEAPTAQIEASQAASDTNSKRSWPEERVEEPTGVNRLDSSDSLSNPSHEDKMDEEITVPHVAR